MSINYQPGMHVLLNTPGNPQLHGTRGVIKSLEDWGAHVTTDAAATGNYRALFEELLPEGANGSKLQYVYSGDLCVSCGSHRMIRTGTCCTCQDCGSNSGCG